MRAALGLVGLLLVLGIVLFNARQSARQLQATPPSAAAPADGAASLPDAAGPRARTEAVREQVQGAMDQAAQRASEAAEP